MGRRSNEPYSILALMCRTNGLSDYRVIGQMGLRTNKRSIVTHGYVNIRFSLFILCHNVSAAQVNHNLWTDGLKRRISFHSIFPALFDISSFFFLELSDWIQTGKCQWKFYYCIMNSRKNDGFLTSVGYPPTTANICRSYFTCRNNTVFVEYIKSMNELNPNLIRIYHTSNRFELQLEIG